MNGINNLLKYRYQRKEKTVVIHDDDSPNTASSNSSRGEGAGTRKVAILGEASQSNSPVLEYQASARGGGCGAAVAQTQFKRGVHVLVDSDDDVIVDDSSLSNHSKSMSISNGSSPASSRPPAGSILSPAASRPSPASSRPSPAANKPSPMSNRPSLAIGNRQMVTASAGSSPWLSKERNVAPARSQVAASQSISSTSVTTVQSSSSGALSSHLDDDDDIQFKVTRLLDFFPDIARTTLAQTLRDSGGSEDRAVDAIIERRRQEELAAQRKRKYGFFQANTEVVYVPPVKRARPLPSESDSSQDPHSQNVPLMSSPRGSQSSSQGGAAAAQNFSPGGVVAQNSAQGGTGNTAHAAVNAVNVAQVAFEARVKQLAQAFPAISKEVLEKALRQNNLDVERTKFALSSFSTSTQQPSLTQNVGSIKAFQLSRVQVKVNGGIGVVSPPVLQTEAVAKKNRLTTADSDSGDDDEADDGRRAVKETATSAQATLRAALDFFNTATVDELTCLDGCSRKKAEYIVALRPFDDWDALYEKFASSSGAGRALPAHLVSECKEVIRLRNNVRALMERCQRLSGDMEAFIAELMSKTAIDEERDGARGYVVNQPRLIPDEARLKPYQMVGLNWLILMHSHGLNGILGDEMGLGKTIQTIAFFAYLLAEGDLGPHLIVAPSSTLDNWLRELRTWCPALKVLMYYGSMEERRELRYAVLEGQMEEFHIIVTTYNMASGSAEDRQLFKKVRFHYAVFDEGHMLKNMMSVRYRGLMKIMAKRRLLLTGTPLQNNLLELMSLLSFAMPDMFLGKTDYFKKIFTNVAKGSGSSDSRGNYEKETLEHAKRILKPFFLRRLKSEVMQQLPSKSDNIMRLPMAFEQQDLYDELKARFVSDVKKDRDSSVRGQSGAAMMMQLRKAANHHLLHRRVYDDARLRQMAALMLEEPTHVDSNVQFVFEDMQVMSDFELHRLCQRYESLEDHKLDDEQITDSGKFRYLDEILPGFKNRGDRVLLFSQFTMMLDIIEDYMKSREHRYIRLDGSTPVAERQELIDQFNTEDDIFVFLLSTKAGGMGINLTAANTVILHDIDFNPYNDKQAEDRCHRIGQSRDVTTYRLISKNTIEEAMLRCAQNKLKLEKDVTGTSKDGDEPDQNDVASLLKEALDMDNVA